MTKQTLQRHGPSTPAASRAPSTFAPRGFGDTLGRLPAPAPQAKLTVNQPGDKYEQEADAVADRVLRMGDSDSVQREDAVEEEEQVQAKPLAGAISPLVQREGEEDEDEEDHKPVQAKALSGASPMLQREGEDGEEEKDEEQAQRKESGGGQSPDVSGVVSQGLSGGGQPLDDQTRAFMEPRFGHDFSQVRIHTDSRASQSSEQIAARAYTVGSDIAFRSGEFSPGSSDGKRLLAHELTHVVQQAEGSSAKPSAARKADRAALSFSPHSGAVQREATLVLQPDWGDGGDSKVTFNPHAEINGTGMSAGTWFPGKTRDKVTIPRDFSGTAKIVADCYWYYHEKHLLGDDRRSGMMTAETSVGLKVEKGKLSFVGSPTISGGNGIPGFIDFTKTAFVPSVAGDNDGSFGLTADFRATSSKTSSTTKTVGGGVEQTTGVNGGVEKGPISVGGSSSTKVGVSGSVAKTDSITTSGTGGAAGSFALDIHVMDAAGPTAKTKNAQVHFAKSGSKQLDDAAPGILDDFYAKLPKEARDDIKSGKTKISLEGHADCKAGNMFNFKLSADRSLTVLKGLQIMDPELTEKNFSRLNRGEEGSKQDGKDHYEDRVVNLSVTYEEAPATTIPAPGSSPTP